MVGLRTAVHYLEWQPGYRGDVGSAVAPLALGLQQHALAWLELAASGHMHFHSAVYLNASPISRSTGEVQQ